MLVESKLIVVDEEDEIMGYETKDKCHRGDGILHRAFSIFIFNEEGQVLIQKRSSEKLLWPCYWSNSVCSHPQIGETTENAAKRRMMEEIGLKSQIQFLFSFQYYAQFGLIGCERELCSVFIGTSNAEIKADPREIEEWKFIGMEDLERDRNGYPEKYTPWFIIEWDQILKSYISDVEEMVNSGMA